jgi:SAM-dependent methyltransferase
VSEPILVHWTELGQQCSARWRSESGVPAPKRVMIADDTLNASTAHRLVCEGTALLWKGDFHNGRQLLQAIAKRIDRKITLPADATPSERFHLHRRNQLHRARVLGMLLLSFEPDYILKLRRAPDVRLACEGAYGQVDTESFVVSLRELLGLVGAHEWNKKGIEIPSLQGRIHPHYGVFAPIRNEYVGLLASTPLHSLEQAFDIGTGTGVLAAVLAYRGVEKVIATDQDPRALRCASENLERLSLSHRVTLQRADLFPEGRAPLIVCNPPWIPARPSSPIECAVYDPDSQMLNGFLSGLSSHLTEHGEGWLILSDIAEHLGLRSRAELLLAFERANLNVIDRLECRPVHPRIKDTNDPLHVARAAEVTSLWRLGVATH